MQHLSTEALIQLNREYGGFSFSERIVRLFEDFAAEDVLVTSSFGASSAFLLHVLSQGIKEPTVHFIDTGNHFPETLDYKNQLARQFGLTVKSISASKAEQAFIQRDKTWSKDPDLCCSINKVQPLNAIKKQHKLWVSGLMGWQSTHRADMQIFEMRKGLLKFHPLLDVTQAEYEAYKVIHELPDHPLLHRGYDSIGCTHCTHPGKGRSGRWKNSEKTECGLHL